MNLKVLWMSSGLWRSRDRCPNVRFPPSTAGERTRVPATPLTSASAPRVSLRLEIRQWLRESLAPRSEVGWLQAFTKLDAMLMNVQAVAADRREVEAWPS